MNRLSAYRLLHKSAKLSEKRHPALEQGKVAKVMMYIGAALMAIYMIFIGSMFGKLAADNDSPATILVLMFMLLLPLDFLLRFIAQQTPMVFVKPFMLLPLKTQIVVESYLLNLLCSGYNLLWLSLLLPYAYINIVAGVSLWTMLAVTVCGLLLVMINSQWYLLVRTLIGRSLLWWLLPVAVYLAIFLPVLLADDPFDPMQQFVYVFDNAPMLWLLALGLVVVLLLFVLFNRNMQHRFIWQELAREQKKASAIKHVWKFSFLERFGQAGEYLKLELKSIMRNKAIRSRVMMSLGLIVMLTVLISYTDVYDGAFILNFWCYYCFAIYGMTALTKVMAPEGNYIDLLMTQHENILLLLRAKYYFHVAILLLPLLIMLPAVIAGKFTMMMMLAYMLLTSGLGYFIMFQLAVYNKQTLPLDAKLTGKNNMESGLQLIIELVGMFAPLLLVGVTLAVTDEDTAYALMAAVGLVLTLLHPLWLRNIYRRMMLRKYENLEGFHATR
jgi:hypothetical protein